MKLSHKFRECGRTSDRAHGVLRVTDRAMYLVLAVPTPNATRCGNSLLLILCLVPPEVAPRKIQCPQRPYVEALDSDLHQVYLTLACIGASSRKKAESATMAIAQATRHI